MPSPTARLILDAVVPPTARWVVALMAQLEEHELDAATRWEFLKRRLEQIGRAPDQEGPH
jgi:hypothetical protein